MALLVMLTGCSTQETNTAAKTEGQQPKAEEQPKSEDKPKGQAIVLATTTSTEDSGLLEYLLPDFEKQSGISVKVVAVGTGQAIKLGEDGNADVVLVHARQAEDKFISDGYGVNAYDVMYNQFYIAGPEDDPAGVKGMTSVTDALGKISQAKSPFISRGDDSGTHKKELSIWKEAGIEPSGDWYLKSGQGMGATLKMADEKGAYTLTDEATYLAQKDQFKLIPVVEGDKSLFNPYGIMQVKSSEKPELAEQLIQYFVSPETQSKIGEFGKDKYGKGLFVPSAKKR